MRPQAAIRIRRQPSRLLLYLPCSGCWVRGLGRGVCGEGLPKHALALLRRLLHRLRAVLARYAPGTILRCQRACIARPRLEVIGEQLDEVGREQADHAPIPLQPAHPPRAIAGIETFDEVAFDKSEVAFSLSSP